RRTRASSSLAAVRRRPGGCTAARIPAVAILAYRCRRAHARPLERRIPRRLRDRARDRRTISRTRRSGHPRPHARHVLFDLRPRRRPIPHLARSRTWAGVGTVECQRAVWDFTAEDAEDAERKQEDSIRSLCSSSDAVVFYTKIAKIAKELDGRFAIFAIFV